jgi:cytochrome c biogenesis protein CcmG, thiol:disulfide interchange protein DsbE
MSDAGFSRTSSDEQRMYGDNRPRRAVWPWVVLLLAVAFIVVWQLSGPEALEEQDDQGVRHPAVGVRMADLSFEPLVGNAESLTGEDLTGRITLINFWGPWCGPCAIEFPHLVELEQHFRRHDNFQFISVSSNANPRDETNLAEWTEQFVKQQRAEFPIYRDPEGRAQRTVAREANMPFFSFPTTLVLDGTGTVRGMWVGYRDGLEREIRDVVAETLAGRL